MAGPVWILQKWLQIALKGFWMDKVMCGCSFKMELLFSHLLDEWVYGLFPGWTVGIHPMDL